MCDVGAGLPARQGRGRLFAQYGIGPYDFVFSKHKDRSSIKAGEQGSPLRDDVRPLCIRGRYWFACKCRGGLGLQTRPYECVRIG